MPKTNEELKKFTDDLAAQLAANKKDDFKSAAKSEKNYEAFIAEILAIGSNAIVEFIVTRQMTTDDLIEYNRERVGALDEWIREKLAELE
jgi:hypothetical protein